MTKIAFIGLGVMGYPMAGHLAASGHEVSVYNRTAGKAAQWRQEYGGQSARSPCAAAAGAEMVFSCVGNDDDVAAVALGEDGALAGMSAGSIYVDHTTTSATVAQRISDAADARGVEFMDAPVSGGQAGAQNGLLTVMCGGTERSFERARPVIESYARACLLMGPAGSGQLTKMVNQICIAGLLQGLAEGLNFGQRAGLDMTLVIEAISKGAAQSWQMDNRAETMCGGEYDFGFAVDWMRKDLDIVIAAAKRNGAKLPTTALINGFYAEVQALGGNRWDTSSLIEYVRRAEP